MSAGTAAVTPDSAALPLRHAPVIAETPDVPAGAPDTGPDVAIAGVPGRITIRGRVSDSAGRAVPAVRVFLEGARRGVIPLDRNGSFVLDVPVSPLDSLIRDPLALWLIARRTGWRIGLASGAPRLRMELRAYDDSLGARHVRVRTNDAAVTAGLARALADGVLADTLDVAFIGERGKDPEPRDLALNAVADIVVVPGRVTSYSTPDTMRTLPFATPVAPDTCACRIEGTIEVQWDRPLPERVPVALWIEGKAAGRDSVELLLGSPRGFVLLATGCGPHRVAYTTYSRLKFTRLTPDPVIECRDLGQRQLRIVIEPLGLRLPR